MEGCGKPPTSCLDSLVVFFDEGQGQKEAGSHQRVVMTCWWLFWARSRVEGCGEPPTSLHDSLMVVLGEVECGGS